MTGELFKLRTGAQIVHVPYKGGGLSVSDTVAGQITSVFVASAVSAPMVKGGKLRALSVAAAKRSSVVPDVPTFDESGVKDFIVLNWFGIIGPAKMPGDITARINSDLAKVVKTPDLPERLTKDGAIPAGDLTPDEFAAFIKAEMAKWGKAVKDSGAKADL